MDPDSSLPRSSRLTIRLKHTSPLSTCKSRSTLFMVIFPLLVCLTVFSVLIFSSDALDASAKGQYFAAKSAFSLEAPQRPQNPTTESKRTWSNPYPLATPILVLLFLGMLFWLFAKSRQDMHRKNSAGGMRSKRNLA